MQSRLALMLPLALAGCSALVETNTEQCGSDADCAALQQGSVCTTAHVCAPAGAGPACSSHRQCSDQLGVPGFCTQAGVCSKLLTPACTEIYPSSALDDPSQNTLLVGFMAALSGSGESYGRPQLEGAKLALNELKSSYGGLPATPASPARRTLAMLICDQKSWEPATEHLVKSLRVPAIVGASYSGITQRTYVKTRELGGELLIFSPAATSPTLTMYPDDGLLWRTTPIDTLQIEAVKLVYQRIAAALRAGTQAAPAVLAEGEAIRIAVTVKGEIAGNALYNALIQPAGPPDTTNPAPTLPQNLRPFLYDDPDEKAPNWASVVAAIVDYQPHVIIPLGTQEFVKDALETIESEWKAKARPWYLMPEGNRVAELLALAAKRPDLKQRVIGTAPGARSGAQWNAFAGRFGLDPANRGRRPGNLAEYAYDAIYLLAYATAISNQAAPTGRALADSLRGVSCPNSALVYAGHAAFASDFARAARDRCVDYVGVSGDLDFNADFGEARSDFDIWCLQDVDGGRQFEPPVNQYSFASGSLRDASLDLSSRDWCRAPN